MLFRVHGNLLFLLPPYQLLNLTSYFSYLSCLWSHVFLPPLFSLIIFLFTIMVLLSVLLLLWFCASLSGFSHPLPFLRNPWYSPLQPFFFYHSSSGFPSPSTFFLTSFDVWRRVGIHSADKGRGNDVTADMIHQHLLWSKNTHHRANTISLQLHSAFVSTSTLYWDGPAFTQLGFVGTLGYMLLAYNWSPLMRLSIMVKDAQVDEGAALLIWSQGKVHFPVKLSNNALCNTENPRSAGLSVQLLFKLCWDSE